MNLNLKFCKQNTVILIVLREKYIYLAKPKSGAPVFITIIIIIIVVVVTMMMIVLFTLVHNTI